jgi:hypothetical protein
MPTWTPLSMTSITNKLELTGKLVSIWKPCHRLKFLPWMHWSCQIWIWFRAIYVRDQNAFTLDLRIRFYIIWCIHVYSNRIGTLKRFYFSIHQASLSLVSIERILVKVSGRISVSRKDYEQKNLRVRISK